jgi:hypothetical protein
VPGTTMAWQVQAAYPFAVGEPAPSRQYRLAGAAGHGVLVDGGRVVWATLGRVAVSCLRAGCGLRAGLGFARAFC